MPTIALLGTGLLGEAIGQRLLQQGLTLRVWNRTPDRCHTLLAAGATPLKELKGAAQGCDAVITVLRDGAVTAEVIAELGFLQGSTVIPMGTMGVSESKALASQTMEQGGRYLEAPVLGSKPQALNGTLLVMAGGEQEVFDQQQLLLKQLANAPQRVGPVGSGAATKIALNQLIASLTHSFSLSLRLIQQAGVPVETFMEILRPSALYAPTFDKKLQRMLDGHYNDPNFSTALLRKDLMLFLQESSEQGLQADGLQGVAALLERANGTDLDALDYCALHELTGSGEVFE